MLKKSEQKTNDKQIGRLQILIRDMYYLSLELLKNKTKFFK